MVITGVFILTILIKMGPFIPNRQQFQTRFYPQYPVNKETEKYADYIKNHSVNPVDYVFRLFEKYDLVVLSERMHPEYTQYELITKIISDKRFAGNIGNIYTECGSVSFQDTLHHYLNTVFLNEDSLNTATATLQRNSNAIWPLWSNTNMFDLLKAVNRINSHLADTLKINWYFTDIPVNWETMTPSNYQEHARNAARDKIMADHIIDTYKNKVSDHQKRTKGLAIMNFRHGYGLIRDASGAKTKHPFNTTNTTAFLMDSLPGKVCNIMMNTVSLRYGYFFTPVQDGKWDRAFALLGNPEAGFDFENSPFGDDPFDGFVGNPSDELQYKDVFTGFIFFKPLDQQIKKDGFPHMLDNFQDSLLRRANCVSASHAEIWRELIKHREKTQTDTDPLPYAVTYNLTVNAGFSFIILLTLMLNFIFFLIPKSYTHKGV